METDILLKGALAMGVSIPEGADEIFRKYYEFLEEKNKVMNLTAINGWEDTVRLHFLDSLALLNSCGKKGNRVIDIGSGAGFPGLPLKIAEPGICLTLLDAQQKRVDFLAELCQRLHFDDVTCIQARAEEQARKPGWRDAFDFAVSRAVARLNVLSELCLPFVKPGGAFIAMKSRDTDEEIEEAGESIKKLGGLLEGVMDYTVPETDIIRRAVLIRKISATPQAYPRRFAKIQKQPL